VLRRRAFWCVLRASYTSIPTSARAGIALSFLQHFLLGSRPIPREAVITDPIPVRCRS
jgi:hypothetical protein